MLPFHPYLNPEDHECACVCMDVWFPFHELCIKSLPAVTNQRSKQKYLDYKEKQFSSWHYVHVSLFPKSHNYLNVTELQYFKVKKRPFFITPKCPFFITPWNFQIFIQIIMKTHNSSAG
jgi:hypothetical protein